jgi:serine/threonine-protein kinase
LPLQQFLGNRVLLIFLVLLAGTIVVFVLMGDHVYNRRAFPGQRSIAVLPFENVGADAGNEYFTDGITEGIIHSLGQIAGLRVTARNSSFHFKGQQTDLRAIARLLGVELIMTGSVQRLENRIRIRAAVVNPLTSNQIWSETYDREFKDIFHVQDEISSTLANSLRLQIGPDSDAGGGRAHNIEAFDLYLKGRYHAARRDAAGLQKALEVLQEATTKDPEYALAFAELGNCYLLMADYGIMAAQDALSPARAALLRSIELQPALPDAHAVLGQMYALFDWNWQNAEKAFGRAIELDPNHAAALHWFAQYLLRMGRTDEALVKARQSLRLDPVSIPTNTFLGWLYFYSRQYQQAKEQAEQTLELNPYFVHAHVLRAQASAHLGLIRAAQEAADRAVGLTSDQVLGRRYIATTYAALNMRDKALDHLKALRKEGASRQAASIGFLCAYIGLTDEAFEWLEKAYLARDPALPLIKMHPALDPYRKDQRYIKMLEKLRMPLP